MQYVQQERSAVSIVSTVYVITLTVILLCLLGDRTPHAVRGCAAAGEGIPVTEAAAHASRESFVLWKASPPW